MTAHEFIEALSRHYSKRHQGEDEAAAWLSDMLEVSGGYEPRIRAKAYQLIRDEHEERAFPLPATIKRFLLRASSMIHPPREHTPLQPEARREITEAERKDRAESIMRVKALTAEFVRQMKARASPAMPAPDVLPDDPKELSDISRRMTGEHQQ